MPRGLSGIQNIGNTCYMNSVIQCLFATDDFLSYMISENSAERNFRSDLETSILQTDKNITCEKVTKKQKETLTYRLHIIFKYMWMKNTIIKPIHFKNKLDTINKSFMGYNQQDSTECLSVVLDRMNDELKINKNMDIKETDSKIKKFWKEYLVKNNSYVTEIFCGIMSNNIGCLKCKNIHTIFESFNIITLPIISQDNKVTTLDHCLSSYFRNPEFLTGKNKYKCEECKSEQDAINVLLLSKLPPKLIIQLKRFEYHNTHYKINDTTVTFPFFDLDMENYIDCKNNIKKSNYLYELYAVIIRTGNTKSGHYYVYSKNHINNKWYIFSDTIIKHIPNSEIKNVLYNSDVCTLLYKSQ